MSGTGRDAPNVTNTTALNMAAFRKNLPGLINIINGAATPTAQANLAAEQSITPGQLALQRQRAESLGQLQTDVINTSGRENARVSSEIDRQINPEFYQAREAGINSLLSNLTALNPDRQGANAEAERLVNAENARTGNLSAPASGTTTVANALQFGDERLKRISALDKALNTATNFMQGSRATFDPQGRQVNTGESFDTGSKQNAALGSDLLGNVFGYTNAKTGADAQQQPYIDKIGKNAAEAY